MTDRITQCDVVDCCEDCPRYADDCDGDKYLDRYPTMHEYAEGKRINPKLTDLIRRADAVKTVIRKCSPICAWQVGTQQYPDSVVAEINALPSADAVQGWNNHEVACMLAELFGDACACNYNGIDEWLPLVCDLKDSCPNIVGVACWEQFLKHYERRKP